MTPENDNSYAFGGFTLIPDERTLLHSQTPVELHGKEFEILLYLVQHNNVLIKPVDLAEAIWGPDGGAYTRNLSHHMARIRKAIGCDARVPKFIKTVHGQKGYRFIAPVTVEHREGTESNIPRSAGAALEIETHLFVPMFLSGDAYANLPVKEGTNEYHRYKKYRMERATLHLMPTGVAVWHLKQAKQFGQLSEFAEWRRRSYQEILRGEHALSRYSRELLKTQKAGAGKNGPAGRPGYVFSVQILRLTAIRNPQTVNRLLQLLASPTSLESRQDAENTPLRVESLERGLLESDSPRKDLEEFGLPGADVGYACWDAVSYRNTFGDDLERSIVEFEIAVQSLWWTCKCISEIFLARDAGEAKKVRKQIPELRRLFAKIKNIGATEPPSRRTMREAVIKTSRLREVFEEAIDLSRGFEN